MGDNISDCEIVNCRVFRAARERVFAAFADAASLARWWGPQGFSNTFHTFEFRPGGRWRFTMHGPNGQDFENESLFREIAEPDTLVIEHLSPPPFVLTVTLEAVDGGTRLVWRQRFETPEMRDKIAKFAGNANEENLDRLASVLGE